MVLVDADLQFGDVAVMLKLAPQHTIVDAVGSLDRLDPTLLSQFLMRHEPSGLLILPAPLEPSFADQISAAEMVQIVQLLRTFCSAVVIDTPAYFNEVVLGLIEESDDVLLVAGMDIPNIKNVKIGLQTLRLLNMPMTQAPPRAEPGELEGEARRQRGRAHAPDQGRVPDPERRRRAAVGQQGGPGGPRRAEVRRGQGDRAAGQHVRRRRRESSAALSSE